MPICASDVHFVAAVGCIQAHVLDLPEDIKGRGQDNRFENTTVWREVRKRVRPMRWLSESKSPHAPTSNGTVNRKTARRCDRRRASLTAPLYVPGLPQ